jgi:hypothetical protein
MQVFFIGVLFVFMVEILKKIDPRLANWAKKTSPL